MSISVVDKISYTLYLSSNDKVSGTNNNAIFNVNWASLFPHNQHDAYKVIFTFQTVGGNFKDYAALPMYYNSAMVVANFHTKSYSQDTSTNSPSYKLGIIQRDIQSTTSSSNTLSCYYGYNPGKTISRPQGDQLTIQLYNNYTYVYPIWVNGNSYIIGNIVLYNWNVNYYTCTANTSSQLPSNVAYWTQIFPTTSNSPYVLLTDTTSTGVATADAPAWNLILEFIPCVGTVP